MISTSHTQEKRTRMSDGWQMVVNDGLYTRVEAAAADSRRSSCIKFSVPALPCEPGAAPGSATVTLCGRRRLDTSTLPPPGSLSPGVSDCTVRCGWGSDSRSEEVI